MNQAPRRSLTCLKDAEPFLRTRQGRPVMVRRLTPSATLVRLAPDTVALCESADWLTPHLRLIQRHDWGCWRPSPPGEMGREEYAERLGVAARKEALDSALVLLVPGGLILRGGDWQRARASARWATLSRLCPIEVEIRAGIVCCTTNCENPNPGSWWLPDCGLRLAARNGKLEPPRRPTRQVKAEWAIFSFLDWFAPAIKSYAERAARDWLTYQEQNMVRASYDAHGLTQLLGQIRSHYESKGQNPALIPSKALCRVADELCRQPGQTLESATAKIAKMIERWLKDRTQVFINTWPETAQYARVFWGGSGPASVPVKAPVDDETDLRY
jgi:hypothetical protein